MQQTAQTPRPSPLASIRRFFLGDVEVDNEAGPYQPEGQGSARSVPTEPAADRAGAARSSSPEVTALLTRMDRLEKGMQVVARTMKQAYWEVRAEIQRMEERSPASVSPKEVEAIVAKSVLPLYRGMEQLLVAAGYRPDAGPSPREPRTARAMTPRPAPRTASPAGLRPRCS